MSTYLSIDLDYWSGKRADCTRFVRKALRLDVPTLVVLEHQDMLEDVNRSKCRRIEHVDYHSDVAEHPAGEELRSHPRNYGRLDFNEGTWLSFVKWRARGEFIWRLPYAKCYSHGYGCCHGSEDPFLEPVSGWADIKWTVGLAKIPWDDVTHVGIAISRDYWRDDGQTYRGVLSRLMGTKTFKQALLECQV